VTVNQVEIFFSIVQRKALTPAVASSLEALAARILALRPTIGASHGRFGGSSPAGFDRRLEEIEQATRQLAA
jgi:hypothetical protein